MEGLPSLEEEREGRVFVQLVEVERGERAEWERRRTRRTRRRLFGTLSALGDSRRSGTNSWGGCVQEVGNLGRFCSPLFRDLECNAYTTSGMIYWHSKSRWYKASGTDY
jgi:hypothetical protein